MTGKLKASNREHTSPILSLQLDQRLVVSGAKDNHLVFRDLGYNIEDLTNVMFDRTAQMGGSRVWQPDE